MAPGSRAVCLLGVCYIIFMSMISLIASQPQYDLDKPQDSEYLSMKLQNLLRRSELSDSAVKGLLDHRTKRVFCNTFGDIADNFNSNKLFLLAFFTCHRYCICRNSDLCSAEKIFFILIKVARKGKEFSEDLKNIIFNLHKNGLGSKLISKRIHISENEVAKLIQ
ncbi:Hypothetical predicted protein [Octopus vulgaris]|uniref:Uncharacterized protein n=1 Tax=Octopus vulgaris TaxID=6645 RepID=A0AA36FG06_OCTVU|nr:Hypothetical predicted protein [Octopus vulgaris]